MSAYKARIIARGSEYALLALSLFILCLGIPNPLGAVETVKMVEKDAQHTFVESQDPAVKLLLERSVKQGLITPEEYEEVKRASE
ncbi:MAG TPA: hypothetical protein VNI35_05300, partial [Nitrospira sp.]|nr:hypothetical protein [Nitrospira sp.]